MKPAHTLVFALGLATLACGGDEAPAATERGRGPFGAAPEASTAPVPSATTVLARHHAIGTLERDPIARLAPPPTMPSSATVASGTGDAPATTEERNLSAELATAIGSPASCIDLATARTLHGRLTIQVSATLTPSGGVTRATASGGSLPEAALTCVQNRALGVHLAAPIERAPRTVSTSLSFDVTTTDDETTRVTPVWHQPGAVAEPGVVLPAGGTGGRPTGTVSPDAVLPAVGATGRPDGTVAPDIVLPAQGGSGTLWPSGAPPPPPTSTTTR